MLVTSAGRFLRSVGFASRRQLQSKTGMRGRKTHYYPPTPFSTRSGGAQRNRWRGETCHPSSPPKCFIPVKLIGYPYASVPTMPVTIAGRFLHSVGSAARRQLQSKTGIGVSEIKKSFPTPFSTRSGGTRARKACDGAFGRGETCHPSSPPVCFIPVKPTLLLSGLPSSPINRPQ
jgi:hypothetical protein